MKAKDFLVYKNPFPVLMDFYFLKAFNIQKTGVESFLSVGLLPKSNIPTGAWLRFSNGDMVDKSSKKATFASLQKKATFASSLTIISQQRGLVKREAGVAQQKITPQ